jgi:acetyl esterase/lipase
MTEVWRRLREIGDEFSTAAIEATRSMFMPLAPTPDALGAVVVRDLAYGPDSRHRLDVFRPPAAQALPVVVFVHGGGFAAGDKGGIAAPFFNNVGAWAVRSGFVGVTVTYRLAPAHVWPAGAADLGLALRWLHAGVAKFGGDAGRIVVVGQSAGAAHLAGCLAGHGQEAGQSPSVAGAVLLSGIFEPDGFNVNPMHVVYYGADRALYPLRSTVLPLAATAVPCLFTISEFDPPQFQRQLAAVFAARSAMTGFCPEVLHLHGHNHFSSSMQIGSVIDTLGPALAAYVRRLAG